MRALMVLATLLVLVSPSHSMQWDFDTEGDAQGWVATWAMEGVGRLPGEVRDGVWRVQAPPYSSERPSGMMLFSPIIAHDSGLFDRVRIRFRVVHSQAPYAGSIVLYWRNAQNRTASGMPGYYVSARGGVKVITGKWQEAIIGDLRDGADCGYTGRDQRPCELDWKGQLLDIQFSLALQDQGSEWPVPPEQVAEAVEIDWIQLTGVEEQLRGELAPPEPAAAGRGGSLFAAAQFHLVGPRGLGTPIARWPSAVLGDMDGNGDVDVAAVWSKTVIINRLPITVQGWVVAYGDGTGGLTEIRDMGEVARSLSVRLDGADLDGDRAMELVLGVGTDLQVLDYDDERGWQSVWTHEDATLVGLADADGDGVADLWYNPTVQGSWLSRVQIVLGGARWYGTGLELGLSPAGDQGGALYLVAGFGANGATAGLWMPPLENLGQGYELAYLTAQGDLMQQHLATAVHPGMVMGAGDLDADGDVDLLEAQELWEETQATYVGLALLRNQGDGAMEEVDWQPQVRVWGPVTVADVNGDGVSDVVFTDGTVYDSAVVVALGRRGGLPQLEGRYPLPQGQGGRVLTGDVDGDGRTDLVVLEPAGYEGGGLHVLLNRGVATAISAPEEGTEPYPPVAFRLGSSYPNPFNPQTCIPLEVPAAGGTVTLQVYDVLGRPVRRLVRGALAPGRHALLWDGRDETGRGVAAGVYLYRLEAQGWARSGKMVKVD